METVFCVATPHKPLKSKNQLAIIIELQNEEFKITEKGLSFFNKLNIDYHELIKSRRQFAKPCLDWTEREFHLAGSLGSALLEYFMKHRLAIRSKNKTRVIILTTTGHLWLKEQLSIDLGDDFSGINQ